MASEFNFMEWIESKQTESSENLSEFAKLWGRCSEKEKQVIAKYIVRENESDAINSEIEERRQEILKILNADKAT